MLGAPMTVELRPYRSGDEAAICDLFEMVFGRPLSSAFWRWRYCDHPGGGPYAELAWDGNLLVGHYAVSASPLAVDGAFRKAALSMTTMIHPDYRGQRLFENSAARLYARLVADGFVAVYGFPNANSHRGFISRLEWQNIYEIPTLSLTLAPGTVPRSVPGQVATAAEFDAAFDTHWDAVKTNYRVWAWRDAAHLRWRYSENPEERYTAAAWRENGMILGYVVTKIYHGSSLDIVELFACEDSVARGLVDWAIAEASSKGISSISMWSPVHSPIRITLESLGFTAGAPVTYFGARSFEELPFDLSDYRNWNFAMCDSDVF